jgi:hypothetical protein
MELTHRALYTHVRRSNRKLFGAADSRDLSRIGERARLSKKIQTVQQGGKVAFYSWSRDCDCCESEGLELMPASPLRIHREIDRLYSDPEGPVSWDILPPSEYEDFIPQQRDAALEAFEDGHPWVIYPR